MASTDVITTTLQSGRLQKITLIADATSHESTHSQHQCPLLRLPPEVRNQIAKLCLTSPKPIINPIYLPTGPFIRPDHQSLPLLVTALLQTCKQLYTETDVRPLYTNNTFHFTRPTHIRAFLSRLPATHKSLLRTLTISLLETHPITATDPVAQEWTHYLTCVNDVHLPGTWCARLSTLTSDLPNLRHLSLDIGGWTKGCVRDGSRPPACHFLTLLFGKVRGMESLEIVGQGLEFWGLGQLMRPALPGSWTTLLQWVESVGAELAGVLAAAVRNAETGEEKWVGWLWEEKRFKLVARVQRGPAVLRGGEQACSWNDCVEKTQAEDGCGNPVRVMLS